MVRYWLVRRIFGLHDRHECDPVSFCVSIHVDRIGIPIHTETIGEKLVSMCREELTDSLSETLVRISYADDWCDTEK